MRSELLQVKKIKYVYNIKSEGRMSSNDVGNVSRGKLTFGLASKNKVCELSFKNSKMPMVAFK